MRLVLMGPPGSGKGAFARSLSQEMNVPHISTGQIIRQEIQSGSELGRLASLYARRGHLVEDSLMLQIVANRLENSDCENGFIFDGFPRTLSQATGLQSLLRRKQTGLDLVLSLHVAEELLEKRASFVEVDGEGFVDYESAVEQFKSFSEPVIPFYRQLGLLVDVDVSGSLDENLEVLRKQIKRFQNPAAANANIPERKIYSI